jgi:hypothetical protein
MDAKSSRETKSSSDMFVLKWTPLVALLFNSLPKHGAVHGFIIALSQTGFQR